MIIIRTHRATLLVVIVAMLIFILVVSATMMVRSVDQHSAKQLCAESLKCSQGIQQRLSDRMLTPTPKPGGKSLDNNRVPNPPRSRPPAWWRHYQRFNA